MLKRSSLFGGLEMLSSGPVTPGVSILEELIGADGHELAPEVAKYFLTLNFSAAQHQRYEVLAGKASEGVLTKEEADALDEFLAANSLLAILQSKARQTLRHRTPAA